MHCHVLTQTVHTAWHVKHAIRCEVKELTLLESYMAPASLVLGMMLCRYVACAAAYGQKESCTLEATSIVRIGLSIVAHMRSA